MKKVILNILTFTSIALSAQVGIGTATPQQDAILELSAPNKALLLPRVANTAAVANPVNGMMIYDISSNCLKGFENGSWSSCISSTATGGGTGNTKDFPSNLKFTHIAFDATIDFQTWGVTVNKELYAWGGGSSASPTYILAGITTNPSYPINTPVYSPTHINHPAFNGKVVKIAFFSVAFAILTDDNKLYVHGESGGSGREKFATYIPSYNANNYSLFPNSPAGFGWSDMDMSLSRFFLIDTNGNAYWTGQIATTGSTSGGAGSVSVTSISNIPHPLSKKFVKVVSGRNGYCVYLIDEDGVLWASGDNNIAQLGNGNTTFRNINSLTRVLFNPPTTKKVVNVTSDNGSNSPTIAILDDGSAYIWSNTSKFSNYLPAVSVSTALSTAVPLPVPPGAISYKNVYYGNTDIIALTNRGVYQLRNTLPPTWVFRQGTQEMVTMFGQSSFPSSPTNFGAHVFLDANGYVYALGDFQRHAFGFPSYHPSNCETSSTRAYYMPTRVLNGNFRTSNFRYCPTPFFFAPFPEPN
jgi:hypothetical protein